MPLGVSERLGEQVVSLPLYPELTDTEAEQVVAAVNA
jgi:dTDP-4-amino-4,6-dideoxygalactose transaminase